MRLGATKSSATSSYNGLGNQLWDLGGARPSLDLNFAGNKNLSDSISTKNLITFTRASSGTYVDSQGVIQRATTNLLLRSEEFNDASWTKNALQAFGSGSVANSIAAPNGTLAADYLAENTSLSEHFAEQNFTALAGLTYTFSVYVKAGPNKTNVNLRFSTTAWGGAVSNQVRFNLINGAITVISGTGTGAATQLNDGWWRFSITATSTANGSPSARVHLIENNGTSNNYTGDGTSGIYIWGAQLEQSSTVGEYIPTTSTINSAPRFDHNPTTGESLGLLVEESRTNLVTNSATFQPSSGGAPASYTVDQVAPDGTTTGSRQTASSPRTLADYTGIANATYTFSFYCRVTSGTAGFSIQLKNAISDTVIASDTSPVATTSWRRFFITGTTNGATAGARIELTGIVPGFVFWGAQLEAGAFPTSYIPTTTAAVTRSADVASITGSNFSSWYRQDEGTIYAEGAVPVGVSGARAIASIDDGTSAERIQIGHNGTTAIQSLVINGNSIQFAPTVVAASFPPNEYRKLAMAVKAADFAAITVPGTIATGSTGTMPAPTQLQIGFGPVRTQPNLPIKRLTYWPQRLPNSTLQQITQ